ncbi:CsbD family protein [Streptomyces sp. NPDC001728]|uniref:CsbD family protein n=1 Tax=Streptomyces sp. NPDC001728 TaxID=3154396 RepID=UPI00332A77A8
MRKSSVQKGKGKVKETVGKVIGDTRMEREGKTDQMAGRAREAMEKVHESALKARDELKRRTSRDEHRRQSS